MSRKHSFRRIVASTCLSFLFVAMIATTALTSIVNAEPYVHEDGFESGDLSGWTGNTTNINGNIEATNAASAGESYSANASTWGNSPWGQGYVYQNVTSGILYYAQAQFRFYTPIPTAGKRNCIIAMRGTSSSMLEVGYVNFFGEWRWRIDYSNETSTKVDQTAIFSMNTSKWFRIEVAAYVHGTDGYYTLWVDGVMKYNKTSMDTTDKGNITRVSMGAVYCDDGGIQMLYMDSAVIDTSYIGTGYSEAVYWTLSVESTPIDGIDFTLDLATYATNMSVVLEEGSYTVSMPSTWSAGADQYNFVEWEDASTNPVRSVSLTSNMTIIATYELYVPIVYWTLSVESTPIDGIDFTLDLATYATNMSVVLEEGSYTVSMPSTWSAGADQYNFVEWEDASTNPSRVVSLTVDMALIATYAKLVPPIASFTFSPIEPSTNETVTLNASASDDPDGIIVGYDWDFGDDASGNGLIVEHAYTAAGNYTITLTVTDNDGLSHTLRKDIEVKEVPSTDTPLELYLAAIGITVIIIIAIAFYYLKSRARRAHEKKNNT